MAARRPLVFLYPVFRTACSSSLVPARASATTAASGVNLRISDGSISTRMDFSPSGRNGQRVMVGNSMRVPIPIMRSVLGHSR